MRAVTISPIVPISLKARLSVFLAAFGTFWLLLEPAGSFGIAPTFFASLGWKGYAILVAVSALATALSTPLYRRFAASKIHFLTFTVRSSSDGAEHFVRSPETMLVGDFTHAFLKHLSRGPAGPSVAALLRTHEPQLQLLSTGAATPLPAGVALAEAGVVNGSICRIAAMPREPQVLFKLG